MNKQAFIILSNLVKEHNEAEWEAARFQKRRPELLPAIVSVVEARTASVQSFEDGVSQVNLDAIVRYRPYYSTRRAGERKIVPPPKMLPGGIKEGQVKLNLVTSEEGKDYTIEFVNAKIKVET